MKVQPFSLIWITSILHYHYYHHHVDVNAFTPPNPTTRLGGYTHSHTHTHSNAPHPIPIPIRTTFTTTHLYQQQQPTNPSDPTGSGGSSSSSSSSSKKGNIVNITDDNSATAAPSLPPPSVSELQELQEEIAAAASSSASTSSTSSSSSSSSDDVTVVEEEDVLLKSVDDVVDQATQALEQAEEALQDTTSISSETDADTDTASTSSSSSTIDSIDTATTDSSITMEEQDTKDTTTTQKEKPSITPQDMPKIPFLNQATKQSPPKPQPKLSKEEQERQAELQQDALASAGGGASIGLLGGIVFDIANVLDVGNPAIPPALFSALLGAIGFGVASQETSVGQTVRSTLGSAFKSIFGSVKDAASEQAKKTVDTITVDIPNQIKTSVQESIDTTKEEIASIPTKVKDVAIETTETIKEAAIETTDKAIEDLKATPGRIVTQTKRTVIETVETVEDTVEKAVEDAVEDINQKVDDLVSLPGRKLDEAGKKLDELQSKVSTIIEGEPKTAESREPKPPDAPQPKDISLQDIQPKAPPLPPKTKPDKIKKAKASISTSTTTTTTETETATATPVNPVESIINKARPGATISLGFFGFGQEPGDTSAKKPDKPSALPPDVPVLSRWKQNSDGTITGLISESSSFSDGESITTTPIEDKAVGGTVVQTISGSRYFLQKESAGLSLGNIFGGKGGDSTTTTTTTATESKEEQKQREEIRKAAEAATVERIKEVRRLEADERRAAAYEAAEEKKRQLEEKKAQIEAKRRDYEDRVAASKADAKRVDAEAKLKKAKPGATISLGFINFGNKAESDSTGDDDDEPKVLSSPPRGVPVISDWKQNRDGSLSGTLQSASNIFRKGEAITTSPITTKAVAGAVVETQSGSKYYLQPVKSSTVSLQKPDTVKSDLQPKTVPKKKQVSNAAAEAKKRQNEEKMAAQAEAKRKAAEKLKEAEVQSTSTISLGFFGFGGRGQRDVVEDDKKDNVVSAPPKGVPVLSSWKQNIDGSISGLISGSSAYDTGDAITTSPIVGNAIGGAVVQTRTGSKYFLEPETSSADRNLGFFNFGGKADKVDKVENSKDQMLAEKEKAKKEKAAAFAAVAQQREDAQAKKEAEQAKKQAARDAIEAKRRDQEAEKLRRKLEAEEVKKERIQKLREAEEEKRRIVEEKKAEAKRVMEEKRALYEQKLEQQARGKREKVQASVESAPKGSTISLGFLSGFGGSGGQTGQTAPRGVPVITKWKQNRDGSITGFISGSRDYVDGESITTSQIAGEVKEGAIVRTTSGSRYFLEVLNKPTKAIKTSGNAAKEKDLQAEKRRIADEAKKQQIEEKRLARIAEFEAKKRQMQEKKEAMIAAAEAKKQEIAAKKAAAKEALEAKRREFEEKAAATAMAKREAAQEKVVQARPGATISLGIFGFGGKKQSDSSPASALASAPRGVPLLSKWRQNRDGSITGFISGSNAFSEGESITTSPISGDAEGGAVVKTVSGSKYYLSPTNNRAAVAKEAKAKAEERKRKLTEQKKIEMEEKKAATVAAAEARKRELEAKRAAAAELKLKQLEEKKAAAAARQKEAEDKRAAFAAAAETKLDSAKPGGTISLGLNFFGGGDKKDVAAENTPKRPLKKKSATPGGVPTISKWKQNRDGSITGFISGSAGYKDGESITTSPLTGKAVGGKVSTTKSGSRYFLEVIVTPAQNSGRSLFGRKSQPKSPNLSRASRKEEKVVEKASPGATISLGFLGQRKTAEAKPAAKEVQMKKKVKPAPRGVPVLSRWRQNRDGSITGFVSGSKAFQDGESITTSPIDSDAEGGTVAQTVSGSRYYLQPK